MPPPDHLPVQEPPPPAAWKGRAVAELGAARSRLVHLLERLDADALTRQHSPLVAPLLWDVARVAHHEEQWLLRALGAPALPGSDFDAFLEASRAPATAWPTLIPAGVLSQAARVREASLAWLRHQPEDSTEPLLSGGFVYGRVVQYEQQCLETLTATLQWMTSSPWCPIALPRPRPGRAAQSEVFLPGGPVRLGSTDPWAREDERPVRTVHVEDFLLDSHPVTVGDYAVFVAAGGYEDARWWTPEGFAWVRAEGVRHPLFWLPQPEGRWHRRRFGWEEPLPPDEPVQHVSGHEADAYARWAGKRLPTEAEWERAASGLAPDTRPLPWGRAPAGPTHATLGGDTWGPAPVGSWPAGSTPEGISGLLGDVWEWTSSSGTGQRVLKGGSWATAPVALRNSARQGEWPHRRHLFTGFRCARDAR